MSTDTKLIPAPVITPVLTTPVLQVENVSVYYGAYQALRDVSLVIPDRRVTAFIGPSGCGKSSMLRCLNRMNDEIQGSRVAGKILYHGTDIYARDVDPVELRRHIGMVFQKPNPFPKSIFENVAFGARINGYKGNMNELVESCLRRAALWDEVKDRLHMSALALSGGQQQRLCIARALAPNPDVILMDEPCSALDPGSTLKIEELIGELREHYAIIMVTHNMQQARRVSDMTAFFNVERTGSNRCGALVEFDRTSVMFNTPKHQATLDYIQGKFG